MQYGGHTWTQGNQILWIICKLLDRLVVVTAKAGRIKGVKSLELPDYPWQESKRAVRRYGDRGGTSSAEIIASLDKELF